MVTINDKKYKKTSPRQAKSFIGHFRRAKMTLARFLSRRGEVKKK
jgi:hypothetical protein